MKALAHGTTVVALQRMAAEGMQFSWRWNGGTISLNLDVIGECRLIWNLFSYRELDDALGLDEVWGEFSTKAVLVRRDGVV